MPKSWISRRHALVSLCDDGWVLLDTIGQPVRKRDGSTVGFKFGDVGTIPQAQPEFLAP